MSSRQLGAVVRLFREAPANSALVSVVPLVLATVQLANSAVNGVSPAVSIPFATGMVAFAVVATGHHLAEHRLQRLEAEHSRSV